MWANYCFIICITLHVFPVRNHWVIKFCLILRSSSGTNLVHVMSNAYPELWLYSHSSYRILLFLKMLLGYFVRQLTFSNKLYEHKCYCSPPTIHTIPIPSTVLCKGNKDFCILCTSFLISTNIVVFLQIRHVHVCGVFQLFNRCVYLFCVL